MPEYKVFILTNDFIIKGYIMQSTHANTAQDLKKSNLTKSSLTLETIENVNLILMFSLAWTELLSIIALPFLFINSVLQLFIAWHAAKIEHIANGTEKNPALSKLLVNAIFSLTLGIALIGAFIATLGLMTIAPFFLIAGYATKILYHLGHAIYSGIKYFQCKDLALKQIFKNQIITNTILGITTTFITIAFTFVLILNKISFGALGIISSFIASAFCAIKLLYDSNPATQVEMSKATPSLRTSNGAASPPSPQLDLTSLSPHPTESVPVRQSRSNEGLSSNQSDVKSSLPPLTELHATSASHQCAHTATSRSRTFPAYSIRAPYLPTPSRHNYSAAFQDSDVKPQDHKRKNHHLEFESTAAPATTPTLFKQPKKQQHCRTNVITIPMSRGLSAGSSTTIL